MCGANGEIIRTSASTASFSTAIVAGALDRADLAASSRVLADAQAFGCAPQNAYSSLTSSISAETAVFRCTRGSRSRGDAADRVVRLAPQRALRVVQLELAGRGNPFAADRLAQLIDQAPDARQEAPAALEAGVGPLDLLLRRRDEHHVQPQRVGAELLDHVVRIDDVALRLRHDLAVLQHHALRQQARERLARSCVMPRSRNTRQKNRE